MTRLLVELPVGVVMEFGVVVVAVVISLFKVVLHGQSSQFNIVVAEEEVIVLIVLGGVVV